MSGIINRDIYSWSCLNIMFWVFKCFCNWSLYPTENTNCLSYINCINCNIPLSNKSNKTPTWCDTVQVSFLQSHSTCFGRQAPVIRSIKKLARQPQRSFVPNMVMWWPTCNYNTCTRGRRASFLILLMTGAWRPKYVEWIWCVVDRAS